MIWKTSPLFHIYPKRQSTLITKSLCLNHTIFSKFAKMYFRRKHEKICDIRYQKVFNRGFLPRKDSFMSRRRHDEYSVGVYNVWRSWMKREERSRPSFAILSLCRLEGMKSHTDGTRLLFSLPLLLPFLLLPMVWGSHHPPRGDCLYREPLNTRYPISAVTTQTGTRTSITHGHRHHPRTLPPYTHTTTHGHLRHNRTVPPHTHTHTNTP